MFADEYRPAEELRQQYKQYLLSDTEELIEKYEQLVERNKELLESSKASQNVGADALKGKSEWESERKDLLRKLGEAHGALKIYREGYWNLRDEISDLRQSRSMRIGRAITSPYQKLKSLRSRQDAELSAKKSESPAISEQASEKSPVEERPSQPKQVEGAPHPQAIEASGLPEGQAIEVDSPLPVGERTFDRLKFELAQNPTSLRLKRVLTRAWYVHGLINEPAKFIQEYPQLVEEFTPRDKQLVEQIRAAKRVHERPFELPPRSRGAAYLVEPERVMYCVHSTPVFNSNGYSIRTRGVAQAIQSGAGEAFAVARPGYPWDTKADRSHPEKQRHQEDFDGVSYVHIPGPNLNTSPMDFYIQMAADAYVREARRLRPQLIHAASNHLTALPALIAARRLGVPFVYEVRGFWEFTGVSNKPGWEVSERYQLAVALEKLVATEADHVIAITSQVADELEKRGVDRDNISIAENAVDPEAILPLPKDMKYAASRKIRTDVPVIGFAGSVEPYEGIATLVEASSLLNDRGIDHQVVIAGSGSSVEALKVMRDEAKLKTVTFLGRIPNAEIPRLLSTFDIMPCPRISEKVTELVSPLKPLEAFSASKAVVLSDVAPHIDLAGPKQERALLFKAGDAKDLANVLQRLIQDKNLSQQLGRAGRLWTLDERNWQTLGEKLAFAYHRAVEEYSKAQPVVSKPLSSVKLGIIADEFTASTLAGACEIVAIDRTNWQTQLNEQDFDAIFVESAWEGNGGSWHRGVGHYSSEESKDLYELLAYARIKGIPSIFWNKEDPVHIERFLKTASQCDHIFTTDANMIPRYLETQGTKAKTVSSLPFYAEPRIHNPLPSNRPYEHSVAYAGTYYGDRYKTRSRQLQRLLTTSEPYGLAIYDRQLQFESSPYKFPREVQRYVRGSLSYDDVLHQYKSHLAQLNVNSVVDSPTMYSRRVVEIAASGGIVLSGPGRGIEETLGSAILASNQYQIWNSVLHAWATDPKSKLNESWRQMRTVLRAHTTTTALSIVLRAAGIAVDGVSLDKYAVKIQESPEDVLRSILKQSIPPTAIVATDLSDDCIELINKYNVPLVHLDQLDQLDIVWMAEIREPLMRTHFEDLLTATRYGHWDEIYYRRDSYEFGMPIARPIETLPAEDTNLLGLKRLKPLPPEDSDGALLLQLVSVHGTKPLDDQAPVRRSNVKEDRKTILFAGHDLKFVDQFMAYMEAQRHRVIVDKWSDHNRHDKEISKQLLDEADIIFSEWGLGNAVWYSKNKRADQRLIVRVHSQELRSEYLSKIAHDRVSCYIFVGELVRSAAVESHGVPYEKTCVVPNAVDVESLALAKTNHAPYNIGLVGIVPRAKRLDLALDVIEKLREHDDRYRLYIKGKQPRDYPWLMSIPDEMRYYAAQYERLERINAQTNTSDNVVIFDPYGRDMEGWYQKIGSVLSMSDFESFHLTLADGAASGATPYSLAWPGADMIYPRNWLYSSADSIAESILAGTRDSKDIDQRFVITNFSEEMILERLGEIVEDKTLHLP